MNRSLNGTFIYNTFNKVTRLAAQYLNSLIKLCKEYLYLNI